MIRRVEFINLAQAGADLELAASRLAAFHYAAGRRVLIHCPDQALAKKIDAALWSFDPASFIPHAPAQGGPGDAAEPVLIAAEAEPVNRAEVLLLAQPLALPLSGDWGLVIDFVPASEGPDLDAARERYRWWQTSGETQPAHITSLP